MRPRHTQHSLPTFPVYSSAFLSPSQLVLGGGGGASRSGIKNKLRLYDVTQDRTIDLRDEFELEKGEDAPMSMAAHLESQGIICGINSVLEKLEKGENQNCRTFNIVNSKFNLLEMRSTLTGNDMDDYQKVTALSPDGTLLAVAGSHDLTLLSYPSLIPVSRPIHTEREIYDVTLSNDLLIVATTHNLFAYSLSSIPPDKPNTLPTSPKKVQKRTKSDGIGQAEKLHALDLKHTAELPASTGEGSTFRAARYHPTDADVLYTIVNTAPSRSRKSKSTSRQAFVLKWNTRTWTVDKYRKISDRSITCVDMSPDGRFLGYGSSDLSIGMLDTKTLSPLITILKAHEFPPTTIRFNLSTTLLVSGSADNTIRIVSIPSVVGGSSWAFIIILILTIITLLLAIATRQLSSEGFKW
ncbi:WD40 repeat-like protein [Pholiota conissans]|uniref:WD40 repeat-like protein n=1 Tax=Pholiota conissans TaxID=109636 RepID=A0A9P5ZAM2_9AGAR|nr:WD40 repeat-like protein [Pholiota conissans]